MDTPDSLPLVDVERLRQCACGNPEQLRHIGGVFCETLTTGLFKLRLALDLADLGDIRRAAHDIKNCLMLVSAQPAVAVARQMEETATLEGDEGAIAAASTLEAWAGRVMGAVREATRGND